ncbi:predicted protein [Nematostella vectensis]|uniref:Dienelactone hydrolase domain-containing protein n=1 Tax=Nematostella vectensis TaxID=45351 RepID=A7RZ37_NEMVE|nr:predicted protein [Nematostella vectensis]|eukprot:XP_001635351.1 predicted protein [Nematostella vectensis]
MYIENVWSLLSMLLNVQVNVQDNHVIKEPVMFNSSNSLGPCPGSLAGNITHTQRCVIVVQEWWGMNEQIKQQAVNISNRGNFVTLVPDLYRGQVAVDYAGAVHLTGNLDYPAAVEDIRGAARYLLDMGCKKVGITGFCMGGSLSLAAAVHVKEISAAVPFYGIPPDSLANVSTIQIPVQCHFGKNDTSRTAGPAGYQELRRKLEAGNVTGWNDQFFEYNAGHAFTNPHSDNYNPAIAELSTQRMIDFLNKYLA